MVDNMQNPQKKSFLARFIGAFNKAEQKQSGNLSPKDGVHETFYDNGQIHKRSHYKNGQLDGEVEIYYSNGIKIASGQYKNGQKDGLFRYYRENGELRKISGYHDGICSLRIRYENGVPHGKFEYYYPNGVLKRKGYLEKGKENGFMSEYYENGKLFGKGNFTDGQKDGCFNYYDEKGNLFKVSIHEKGVCLERRKFENGVPHGECLTYYPNGQVKYATSFKNGLQDGPAKMFYENGQLCGTGNFTAGFKNGRFEYFDKNEKLMKVSIHENGQCLCREYYDENGDLKDKKVYGDKKGITEKLADSQINKTLKAEEKADLTPAQQKALDDKATNR